MGEKLVGELALPKDRAIVSVARDELIDHVPFAPVVSDVARGKEGATSGDRGDRRHTDIIRFVHKLRHVGRFDHVIRGHRIVVRTVFPMAPLVNAFGCRLPEDD